MDGRPGKAGNNSKLTGKYIAGRGRALKEFSRTQPKAEEVERRKQVQQLFLSGQLDVMLDKLNGTGKNGSTSDSMSSSSSQLQLDEMEIDSYTELNDEINSSKAPMQSAQWQRDMKTTPAFHNDLENHINRLNIDSSEDGAANNNLPPRFRNKQLGKHFKKQKPPSRLPNKSVNERLFKMGVSQEWDNSNQTKSQDPVIAANYNTESVKTNTDPWDDWERLVVAPVHVIDDEDLDEIIAITDNDNLDDVMVQQYVNALHQEKASGASKANRSKATPSRIQAIGNLKSTTNADSYQVPPGTIPNPPKGPDRWGGKELKNIDGPTGWGELVEDSGNWYEDGSSCWSRTSPNTEDSTDKCIGAGTWDTVLSSPTQVLLKEAKNDSSMDLTGATHWLKVPVESTEWQKEMKTAAKPHNNQEDNKDKLNTPGSEDASSLNNLPPRFRNKLVGENFKKQQSQPGKPNKSVIGGQQFEMEASQEWGNPNESRKQEPFPVMPAKHSNQKTSLDIWDDWETSVVAPTHAIDDEDLDEIMTITDNDNLDDVMVQQYVNALHQEKASGASKANRLKATFSRIQAIGNLKSTTNADSYQVPPGTIPNPPKGPDRWGGTELKAIDGPTGWGELVEDSSNWYDDGSNLWSTTEPQAKETVEKCIGAGKHGSTGDFVSSSSSQLQLEETKVDSCVDSTGDIHWSRTSMGSPQWQGDIKTTSVFHNELENHINKVNVAPNEDHDSNNNFPPRFRDKKFGKYYKSQKPQPGQPKKSVNAQQFEKGASQEWDNPNWTKKQEPLPAKFNTQETNPDSDHFPPGTIPNPPKGPDGGKELKGIDSPTGWGEPVDNPENWYDDGSIRWSNSSTTSGGWSWNC